MKKQHRKMKKPLKVKEVRLRPTEAVRVVVPSGVIPVVAADPVKRTVEIIPVKRKRSWWEVLVGG